jgi:phage-related holin
MGQLLNYLKVMFGVGAYGVVDSDFIYFLSCNAVLIVLLVVCSIDHRGWISKLRKQPEVSGKSVYEMGAVRIVLMIIMILVSFAFLVGDSYNPFLYFRF